MRRSIPLRNPSALLAVTILGTLAMAAGCSADPEPAPVTATRVSLDCERLGFPCTWNDVAPETVRWTKILAELAALYERSGASMQDVATFLGSQPRVVQVETIGTGVRFRLDAGRPAWVYPGNELAHHRGPAAARGDAGRDLTAPPSAPAANVPARRGAMAARFQSWMMPALLAAPQEVAEGVADDEPGTGKQALILAPYEWQFPGNGPGAVREAEQIRDYQPEHGGDVTYHADLDEWGPNPSGPRIGEQGAGERPLLDGDVQFEDFLHWDRYNLIVLLSHGTIHYCQSIAPAGGERRVSGQVPDVYPPSEDCPLIWAGRAKQERYGAYVGVEIVEYADPMYETHPGLTIVETVECARQLASIEARKAFDEPEPKTAGGKPCRRYLGARDGERLALWTPFFQAQYPKGLQNTFVVLASCRSAVNGYLLEALAPDGNRNVSVFGFDNSVDAGEGLALGQKLVEYVRRGFDAKDIEDLLLRWDGTQFLVGRTLALGDDTPDPGPARVRLESPTATHGRDIVLLVDPATGEELKDGATVRVVTRASGDGDLLRVHPQLLGVGDGPTAGDRMSVRVVGESPPGASYRPVTPVEEGAFRYDGPVTLGRAFREGETVDLEVRIDLPGDGVSRWVYEDIHLVGDGFTLDVSGDATGSQEGWIWVSQVTSASADPSSGVCHAVIHFEPAGEGLDRLTTLPTFGLSIGARGGLRAGEYPVGADVVFGNRITYREAHPDTFFAALGAKLAHPDPQVAATFSGVTFFSKSGVVSIDYIDAERIEGSFVVEAEALMPRDGWVDRERFQAGRATVRGDFSGSFAPDPSRRRVRFNRSVEDVYGCAAGSPASRTPRR
ncbi:MAG: hypothetical protein R2752_22720 [Vicinamibacterales bacterium]